MRAMWKGAVSFGLVNVPVKLYAATQEHDIRFHQVHRADGGRIRMRRTCSACGQEVRYDELAKGYEADDGRLVVLTDEDLESLPVATSHEIDVVEFVPAEQVDPILFGRSYYLEPDARSVKPYTLLREALAETDRMGVVKVALRQRETLAVLRVRGDAILLQTLLWPDEVRAPEFEVLDTDVTLRPQELAMASSLVESLSTDFDPDAFTDDYQVAMADLVERRLEGATPAPVAAGDDPAGDRDVVDLLTALQRSVERVKGRSGAPAAPADPAGDGPAVAGEAAGETATGEAAAGETAAGKAAPKRRRAVKGDHATSGAAVEARGTKATGGKVGEGKNAGARTGGGRTASKPASAKTANARNEAPKARPSAKRAAAEAEAAPKRRARKSA